MTTLDPRQARLVKAGTEVQMKNLHGKILGRTLTVVSPQPNSIMIRVMPTYTCGITPIGSRNVVWANVFYKSEADRYLCLVYNLGPGILQSLGVITKHPTLKSAIRTARRVVQRNASTAPAGFTRQLNQHIFPLISIYPSIGDIERAEAYDRQYWKDVEQDEMDEMDRESDEFFGYLDNIQSLS